MARKKYFAIKYINGNVDILHDNWYNIQGKVTGVSNIKFKSFNTYADALAWVDLPAIPHRKAGDPFEKDRLYIFVDGSYTSKLGVAGWGWVAVINDFKLWEGYGVVRDSELLASRNICGELQATMEAVLWYTSSSRDFYCIKKPIIVHDYAGIANWVLGYWNTNTDVSNLYRQFMFEHADGFFDFEKVDGHTGDKWNNYADELTRRGYNEEDSTT